MSSLVQVTNTTDWIRERLLDLKTQPDTAAYVVEVLASRELIDLINSSSIMMAYAAAGADFEAHRRLADSVLAAEIAFKGWLAEPELCISFARRSYATCFRLLGGQWACYAELASRLPEIITASHDAWLNCRTKTPHGL